MIAASKALALHPTTLRLHKRVVKFRHACTCSWLEGPIINGCILTCTNAAKHITQPDVSGKHSVPSLGLQVASPFESHRTPASNQPTLSTSDPNSRVHSRCDPALGVQQLGGPAAESATQESSFLPAPRQGLGSVCWHCAGTVGTAVGACQACVATCAVASRRNLNITAVQHNLPAEAWVRRPGACVCAQSACAERSFTIVTAVTVRCWATACPRPNLGQGIPQASRSQCDCPRTGWFGGSNKAPFVGALGTCAQHDIMLGLPPPGPAWSTEVKLLMQVISRMAVRSTLIALGVPAFLLGWLIALVGVSLLQVRNYAAETLLF